jgi:hypothetical protein
VVSDPDVLALALGWMGSRSCTRWIDFSSYFVGHDNTGRSVLEVLHELNTLMSRPPEEKLKKMLQAFELMQKHGGAIQEMLREAAEMTRILYETKTDRPK